ncbi:MAG: hypothetical protein JWN30_2794 [Bacilli bacterium]|nr:hypothetical protein [Bacilli bacterium]
MCTVCSDAKDRVVNDLYLFLVWAIRLIIIGLGILSIVSGLRLTKQEHRKSVITDMVPTSEHPLGCVFSIIFGWIFTAVYRLLPVQVIKVLRILVGIVLVVIGIHPQFIQS